MTVVIKLAEGDPSTRHGPVSRSALAIWRTSWAWCAELGIRHVTVWAASADNIRKRDSDEVALLMRVAEDIVAARLGRPGGGWRVHLAGEQRLSDFLLWQGADAELFFCDVYWPAFRYIDLLRAMREYGRRAGPTSGPVPMSS